MSKIQFNELNTSELEVLNSEATAEVVGGYYGYYGGYYSDYYSSYTSFKTAAVDQFNGNSNSQAALGGGKRSNTSNRNGTSQNNNANIYQ